VVVVVVVAAVVAVVMAVVAPPHADNPSTIRTSQKLPFTGINLRIEDSNGNVGLFPAKDQPDSRQLHSSTRETKPDKTSPMTSNGATFAAFGRISSQRARSVDAGHGPRL